MTNVTEMWDWGEGPSLSISRSAEVGAGVVLSTVEDDGQVTHMKSKPPLL